MRIALVVSLIYGLLSSSYIVISSYLTRLYAETPEIQFRIEAYKGVFFIALTSFLIFTLTYILLKKISSFQRRLSHQQEQMLIMEKYRMVSLISSIVGHDINNALAIANISLGLMKEKGNDENKESIQSALSRARDLAKSLSSKSRKNSSEETVEFDPNQVVGEAFSLIRKHPSAMNCKLSLNPCEPFKIKGNPQLLEQAIINLILNAAAATKGSGVVRITMEHKTDNLKIFVDDNGPGIPPEKRTQIFEPFFTTKPEGTGLGLLSVQMCAMSHHGIINVKNSKLGGACFELVLSAPITQEIPVPATF